MAPLLLLSPSGEPYSTNGFQSLSDKTTLCLRPDNILKHAVSASPQWCPTLDVLAIPEGHALRLVRLSGGQTVWRRLPQDHLPRHAALDAKKPATDPDLISALTWHPTGSYIAVVYADGLVVQREPAHGEVIHEAKINLDDDERVVSLQWVKCMGSESNSHIPKQTMDMQLPLPRLAPLRKGEDGPGHINPSTSEDLTAMIAVTSHGTVWMSLYGTFALPLKRLATLSSTVVRACISSDTRKLFVVTSSNDRHESQLSILDTSLLAVSSPLLSELASSSAHLSGLCLHLENVIESIAKECVTRNEGSSRKTLLDSFESVLRDHGVEEITSPEAELTRLAVTGRATDSSSQFLLNKFKTTRLKTWENAGRLGAVDITRLAYQHALPAIERTMLAVTNLLRIVNTEIDTDDRAGKQRVCCQLQRVVVVLAWMYSRVDEFMLAVCEEQRENQEFVDWALLTIEDIIWQNGGSSRSGSRDEQRNEDEGARPVRPHVDYRLLLRFIRSAFRRPQSEYVRESSISDIVFMDRKHETRELVDAYIDVLVEHATTGAGGTISSEPKPISQFVFHSRDILKQALQRTGVPDEEAGLYSPPTCQEALHAIRSLIDEALSWSSKTLSHVSQWDADHVPLYTENRSKGEQLVDMHKVSSSTHQQPEMYLASTMGDGRVLQISCLSAIAEQSSTAAIELAVQVREGSAVSSFPITVSGVSFFDDRLLGIVFTVKGFDTPLLGAIEYRNPLVVGYSAIAHPDNMQALVFSRLQVVNGASSEFPMALSSNGAKGRRCIAVIEKCGRQWWPFDMDEEDEHSEDD